MIVVDTSVWVAFFNGQATPEADLLDDLLGRERILVGDLILAEILQGFRRERNFRRARELLDAFDFAPMVGKNMAIRSARNYRKLRSLGVTVRKTIDVMIGTFCLTHGLALLHADHDFAPMEQHLGLDVVRP